MRGRIIYRVYTKIQKYKNTKKNADNEIEINVLNYPTMKPIFRSFFGYEFKVQKSDSIRKKKKKKKSISDSPPVSQSQISPLIPPFISPFPHPKPKPHTDSTFKLLIYKIPQ